MAGTEVFVVHAPSASLGDSLVGLRDGRADEV